MKFLSDENEKQSFSLTFIVGESLPWPTESWITPKSEVKNILCYQYLQLFLIQILNLEGCEQSSIHLVFQYRKSSWT